MSKLQQAYEYAKRNGYAYNFDAYVADSYIRYRDNCARCEVEPMTRDEWDAVQAAS